MTIEPPPPTRRTIAAIELIGRTGAKSLEVGYLHEDATTVEEAGWWASANYQGAKVIVEDRRSPDQALDHLLAKLLDGAECVNCGRTVTNRKARSPRKFCRWELPEDSLTYVRGCDR